MGWHRKRAGKNRRSAYEILALVAEGPLPPYSPFADLRYYVDIAPRGDFWQVSQKVRKDPRTRRLPGTRMAPFRHGRGCLGSAERPYAAVQPPSTGRLAPVIWAASSLHRNSASEAICSTVTNSFVGWAASRMSLIT